jgi:hypothetical protein
MPYLDKMTPYDNIFYAREFHILKHLKSYEFAPSLEHYTRTKAVCDEIAEIKRQRIQYKKSMTKEERRECKAYRHRFDNEYHNPTLIEEGLKAWAADCFEPLDRRDNSIIQLEWQRDNLSLSELPISYE